MTAVPKISVPAPNTSEFLTPIDWAGFHVECHRKPMPYFDIARLAPSTSLTMIRMISATAKSDASSVRPSSARSPSRSARRRVGDSGTATAELAVVTPTA